MKSQLFLVSFRFGIGDSDIGNIWNFHDGKTGLNTAVRCDRDRINRFYTRASCFKLQRKLLFRTGPRYGHCLCAAIMQRK